MNVSTDDIRKIPAGTLALFPCEGGGNIRSARSLMSIVKETETMQDGVVDYESKKYKLETGLVLAIRALREGDTPIF